MIKSYVLHGILFDHIAAMERWYYRDHAPEIAGRFGPWAVRMDSYLPIAAQAGAERFGYINWRMTEVWWREMMAPGASGAIEFTAPPVPAQVNVCITTPQPSEDFCGAHIQPHQRTALRWFVMMKYPASVTKEEGERWFLETHAPELMRQPGLWRFFSHKGLDHKTPLPGHSSLPPLWDRVYELWYDNFADWRRAVIEESPAYTPPPWAKDACYPFLRAGTEFISTFLLERPTDEFLRQGRSYL